ncbi:MAG: NAD-dependent epimerase/dehydratase family protein [Candidatus Eiseniibacteriota bacterium]|jgi:nucleoside-diphosphate-sugar epimerase
MASEILVTGASGFTGWHLTRRLVEAGRQVRVLTRATSRREHLEPLGVEFAQGDLCDTGSLNRAVLGIDTVYHIAAGYRDGSLTDADLDRVNAAGTLNLLDAADRAGVRRLVHCSTIGVHGNIRVPPAREETDLAPGDGYQRSKLRGERAAAGYHSSRGIEIAIFRPCAIYGPGDLRFLKLFRAIARRRFVMLGRGRALYHMVFIDDLVDGILLCGSEPGAVGQTFILGGEAWTDLNQLVGTVAAILGVPRPVLHLPFAPAYALATLCEGVCRPLGIDPPLYRRRVDFFRKNRAFDISRARQRLGYRPRVGLHEGLKRTADWYVQAGLL